MHQQAPLRRLCVWTRSSYRGTCQGTRDLVDSSTTRGIRFKARGNDGSTGGRGATANVGRSGVNVTAADSGCAACLGSDPEAEAAEGGTCFSDAFIVTVVQKEEESRLVSRLHAGVVFIDDEEGARRRRATSAFRHRSEKHGVGSHRGASVAVASSSPEARASGL